MSEQNLKEVEIVTQRIEDQNNPENQENQLQHQDSQNSDQNYNVAEEKNNQEGEFVEIKQPVFTNESQMKQNSTQQKDTQNHLQSVKDTEQHDNQEHINQQFNEIIEDEEQKDNNNNNNVQVINDEPPKQEEKIEQQQNQQQQQEQQQQKEEQKDQNSGLIDQKQSRPQPAQINIQNRSEEPMPVSDDQSSTKKKSNLKNPYPQNNDQKDQIQEKNTTNLQLGDRLQSPKSSNMDDDRSGRNNRNSFKPPTGTDGQEEKNIFDLDSDEDQQQNVRFKSVERFLESNKYQIFVTFLTIYALFADDIRVMATNKNADIVFDVFTIFTMFVFLLELVLSCISKKGYFLGFFFWLDFISTISLLFDIQFFTNELFYGGDEGSTSVNASQLAQAGKASRVGTRAGRIVRLVRLIRLVKIYKLSQQQIEQKQQQQQKIIELRQKKKNKQSRLSRHYNAGSQQMEMNGQNLQNITGQKRGSVQSPQGTKRESVMQVQPDETQFKESRVSRKLSDLTTKRVIMIVLLLLFIMPLFSSDYYFDYPSSIDFAVDQFSKLSNSSTTQSDLEKIYDSIVEIHQEDIVNNHLVFLYTPFSFLPAYKNDELDDLRLDEQDNHSSKIDLDKFKENHTAADFPDEDYNAMIAKFESADSEEFRIQGILSTRKINIITAGLSFGRTIFVCIVLTCGALMFTRDANVYALTPIESLIKKVSEIARNPLIAKEQALIDDEKSQLETVIIENAIIKIGILLVLGFGDAGTEIIATNMQKSGDADPMIPGAKKCAIYGFCDIRNFTDATEVLQEDVMIFVNNIGEVVHTMTDRFQGAANKNIGDAFLLVWKIPQIKYSIIEEDNKIVYHDMQYMSRLADMTIISFMKIQVKLNREKNILKYREDQRLNKRMQNYKVRLGYGLHIGWGIEGAIGSEYKIDASYLSPNVNMAARLEQATKQFGTPILISSALQEIFTPEMKKHVRYIDRVTVKGSNQPIGLYTVDQVLDDLVPSEEAHIKHKDISKSDREQLERHKKNEIAEFLNNPENWDWDASIFIQSNKDLKMATPERDDVFYQNFEQGFQAYLDGNWNVAKQKFDAAKQRKPDDGPLKNLLDVLQETNNVAPKDWPGYRVLTEK